MQCKHAIGYIVGRAEGKTLIIPSACKQWDCPACAIRLQQQWRARIIHGINELGVDGWAFYTLTAHEHARGMVRSMSNIQNGWKRFSARLRRYAKCAGVPKIHYVRVYEQHQDGSVHWHMLASFTPTDWKQPEKPTSPGSRWVKDNARSCGMGYQVRVLAIEGHAGYAAAYVTKYMTKLENLFPKGTRVVQTSQGWPKKQADGQSEYVWSFMPNITEQDVFQWYAEGRDVVLGNEGYVTSDNLDQLKGVV